METKERIQITLDGADGEIDAREFLKVVKATVEALSEVGSMSNARRKWMIGKASHNSPLNMELVGTGSGVVANLFLSGMKSLEEDKGRPRYFSERALRYAKSLSTPLNRGISTLVFSTDTETVRITQRVAAAVDDVRRPQTHEAETEIEGRLEMVDVHGGAIFCIYDPLSGNRTECEFDETEASIIGAKLNTRLRVWGVARFRHDKGWPHHIKVKGWSEIDESKVPSMSDLHKSGIKILNGEGESSEEHISELRKKDAENGSSMG